MNVTLLDKMVPDLTEKLLSHDAVKLWLYSVREMCRIRRFHLNEIDCLTEDMNYIRDGRATVYHLAHVKNTDIYDPTGDKVVKIIDKYATKINEQILAVDRIDLEIEKVKSRLNRIFCESEMSVSEYEVLCYYFFEGMSNDEVAIATFYSVDMVYKLKASAIKTIVSWEVNCR